MSLVSEHHRKHGRHKEAHSSEHQGLLDAQKIAHVAANQRADDRTKGASALDNTERRAHMFFRCVHCDHGNSCRDKPIK